MRNYFAALAVALLASAAVPAVAFDANFALGTTNMNSASGGAVQGGGTNGGGSALAGVTGSQTNQSSWTTGLAGTKLTLDNNGGSIVSEHTVAGGAQQSMVGGSLGFAASGGVGSSGFIGQAASSGQFLGIAGHLSF